MVFVKVREVYDLKTVKNKMSVIAVHTPRADIIKANFPGLLMQCKGYRPYSVDVRCACASVMPLDPLGVTNDPNATDAVAPEDLFNPILYKAITNVGMSQLEARIVAIAGETQNQGSSDVYGNCATVDVDSVTNQTDEFGIYYGLLSNCHGWKTASPQAGFQMTGLRPMVYEMLYNVGDMGGSNIGTQFSFPAADGAIAVNNAVAIRGNPKPLPMMNCTAYTQGSAQTGFSLSNNTTVDNHETGVPAPICVCGVCIIPPSKLHELFYRLVVEWTLEFTAVRPISEVTGWATLATIGSVSHHSNFSYASTKQAITGTDETILSSDASMVSANVDLKKVM